MSNNARISLARLREIGWDLWDPISLRDIDPDRDAGSGAGEYDSYLLRVAGMLCNREPIDTAVDYLVSIETEHMGMGLSATARGRAEATVRAIESYLAALPPGRSDIR
jgi:hypothetical protein